MLIAGLQKTTLLDYPGHLAATVFLGGCNFRCPYCHNRELISPPCSSEFSVSEILSFLKKRKNILEGVCITGGEPTLERDLENFIREIRSLGFKIKLDTNGFQPDVLIHLCRENLLDYVAMDIKAGREHYSAAAGLSDFNPAPVEKSIHFLLSGAVPYEFRTTAVKGLHTEQDFMEIGPWIAGADAYYIQNYKTPEDLPRPGLEPFSRDELLHFAALIAPYVPGVKLRGVD